MAINRLELVNRHNPILHKIDIQSPLTVGNGELGFTADVTGMQTLYDTYQALPLCTMSQWGWHTKPVSEEKYAYTLEDVVMTEYDCLGKKVYYPKKKMPGNEEVYDWLRFNPHRLNLARIGLLFDGKEIKEDQISEINQELHLYEGILESSFKIFGTLCHVKTACDPENDCLAFEVSGPALSEGRLSVQFKFPYGSHKITASDWENMTAHHIDTLAMDARHVSLKHTLDRDKYYITIASENAADIEVGSHEVLVNPPVMDSFSFTVTFAEKEVFEYKKANEVLKACRSWWKSYWEEGGIVQLNKSKDTRAVELERRIILSQYLMAINSAGSTPPQETGLTCNSWYGKMHLEMYLWHCAWLPLWNQTKLLERSLIWYIDHLKEARENAARNGYKGARWPKMIASEGIDCPSAVAPLLVWQQPHIIYMLELAYQRNPSNEFLNKYWILIEETAEFMIDFVNFNKDTGCYDIPSPVIPVQECHKPEETKNPAFEVEYWYVTLNIATKWAERLGIDVNPKWKEVGDHMAPMAVKDGLYLAHELCPDTFEKFNRDHPSMTGSFGLLNGRVDANIMRATLHKVLECWNYPSLWGWDFAMMAMTAVRLSEPDVAIDILMKDTFKNRYVVSGNNWQESRADLPLYLPGNGALLLAIPIMTAGYKGCTEDTPGFPKDGNWVVEFEGISPYFE